SSTPDIELLAALAFARVGDRAQASRLADQLAGEFDHDTIIRSYWLPTIRAAIEIDRGQAQNAIELLQPSEQYQLGEPVQSPSHGTMYPVYVRGLAFLQMGDGEQAAREFQKIIDHRALVSNSTPGALVHLQLGRAYRLMGDPEKARQAYGAFL